VKRLDQITLRQLRALRLIAEKGSISGAAHSLGLTAPAVHNQLKTMEEAMGVTLLLRDGRSAPTLSPQGAALVRAEARMRATLDRAFREIDALDRGRTGVVVLGAVSTAKYVAPRIVARLDAAFPDIEVLLRVANRADTIAALSRGEFDLCIMGRPPREPLTDAVRLAGHPHVLIAAPDDPLVAAGPIDAAAIGAARFILREDGAGTRLLAERYLEGIEAPAIGRRIEMDSNETIKQSVMNRLGIALISAHTVFQEVAAGRLAVLDAPGMPVMRSWFLLRPLDAPLSPAASAVADWIEAHAGDCFPDLGGWTPEKRAAPARPPGL
jgi:DNA-binding transcriptional LysR family regulator